MHLLYANTMAFYIRDLSIHRLWYPWEVLEPISRGQQVTTVLVHCILTSKIFNKKSDNFIENPMFLMSYYSLASYKILYLSFSFKSLTEIWISLGLSYLKFVVLLGYICSCLALKLGSFQSCFSSNILPLTFLLLFFQHFHNV